MASIATFNLIFLGLVWPWVGEFVGFMIIFTCFPSPQNSVNCKHRNISINSIILLVLKLASSSPLHGTPINCAQKCSPFMTRWGVLRSSVASPRLNMPRTIWYQGRFFPGSLTCYIGIWCFFFCEWLELQWLELQVSIVDFTSLAADVSGWEPRPFIFLCGVRMYHG